LGYVLRTFGVHRLIVASSLARWNLVRVDAAILVLVTVAAVGCAHGEPSESATNLDGAVGLDGEGEDATAHDGPAPESSAADAPVDDAVADVPEETGPCDAVLIINEVQTAGSASADDEFVELHNADSCAIPLDGYTLLYRSSDGASDLLVWTPVSGQKMGPGQFFVIGGKDYGGASDFKFPAQVALGGSGGGLGLVKDEAPIDSLAWGDATNDYVEAAAAAAPGAGKSIGRLPDGHDTDDNSADFIEATATPRKPNSPL
jgi:hypothetical protein